MGTKEAHRVEDFGWGRRKTILDDDAERNPITDAKFRDGSVSFGDLFLGRDLAMSGLAECSTSMVIRPTETPSRYSELMVGTDIGAGHARTSSGSAPGASGRKVSRLSE